MDIGYIIRKQLKIAGITQHEAAKRITITRPAFNDVLNRPHLNTKYIESLSEIIGVNLFLLIAEEYEKGKEKISPEELQKFNELYEKFKRLGVINHKNQ
jgi:transcriptional regulator with XRE-family HTH domain